MELHGSGLCADCGKALAAYSRAGAGGDAASAHVTPHRARQRCETCETSRSNVNITVCGLLLAALLSYLWYGNLTRSDEPVGAPVVTIYNWLTQRAAAPAPPAPVMPQPLEIRVSPIVVTARARAPRPQAQRQPPRHRAARGPFRPPPREMDGLY